MLFTKYLLIGRVQLFICDGVEYSRVYLSILIACRYISKRFSLILWSTTICIKLMAVLEYIRGHIIYLGATWIPEGAGIGVSMIFA